MIKKVKLKKNILIGLLALFTVITAILVIREPWRKKQWIITEYPSTIDSQSMFYTIKDDKGNLVVIDGGHTADEKQVRNVILKNGGHVSAWILTHPHPDHIGAFNALYPKISQYGITIDKIYATDVNKEEYEKKALPWDEISYYHTFEKLSSNMKNLTYLHDNDKIELLPGLPMKVLHAWDKNVDKLENGLPNNGSIMFKIYGHNESMLFCSDTQKEMEPYIYANCSKDLKSDYVQCAHHGNWGLSTDFYDKVNPKVAFMDAPPTIVDETTKDYDAYILKKHLLDRNVLIDEFNNAPNIIVIK